MFCDHRPVSRRDIAHLMDALWDLSGGKADVGVAVADIDEATGRGHGDMRTALNLASLRDDGRAAELEDGRWALTSYGVAWLKEDRSL